MFTKTTGFFQKVCELIEVNGLAKFVYSDGAVAPLEIVGMLRRDAEPGSRSGRRLVLAELPYAEG